MNWWRNRESNPARRSCKDHLQPAAFPMVEMRRIEPLTLSLRTRCSPAEPHPRNWWTVRDSNSLPPQCHRGALPIELTAHGAWGRFRAHLSASSARRFHQISFPGELERSGGIEPLVGSLATSCSAIELRPRGGAWSESNHLPHREPVYSRPTAPACPYLHAPEFGCGPGNRILLCRLMRPDGSPDLYPQYWRRAENSNLTQFPVPSGFEAVPARLSG
jgi:hypothetical protein